MNAHIRNGNINAPFAVVCFNALVEYPLGRPVAGLT